MLNSSTPSHILKYLPRSYTDPKWKGLSPEIIIEAHKKPSADGSRFHCVCGGRYTKVNKKNHYGSQIHSRFIAELWIYFNQQKHWLKDHGFEDETNDDKEYKSKDEWKLNIDDAKTLAEAMEIFKKNWIKENVKVFKK